MKSILFFIVFSSLPVFAASNCKTHLSSNIDSSISPGWLESVSKSELEIVKSKGIEDQLYDTENIVRVNATTMAEVITKFESLPDFVITRKVREVSKTKPRESHVTVKFDIDEYDSVTIWEKGVCKEPFFWKEYQVYRAYCEYKPTSRFDISGKNIKSKYLYWSGCRGSSDMWTLNPFCDFKLIKKKISPLEISEESSIDSFEKEVNKLSTQCR